MKKTERRLIRFSLIGGGVASVIMFMGTYLLGNITQGEAINNLQEIRPTLRFTASAAMTATATVLALMLTLLSFTSRTEHRLKTYHYERIRWIARFSAGTFIAAVVLLMFLNLPINNSEESFAGLYDSIYTFLIVYAALLGGAIITVVLLLYEAVMDIIILVHPSLDSGYLFREEE